MADRNGHIPSSWLSASLWGQRSLLPTLQETLSAHGGAAPRGRRGPQPCPNGASRAAVVWCETQKGAQSALIPGAPGRRSGLAAQPPAGRGAAKTLAAQAPGLPSPPPPLLCRMVPSPNASACLHSPNEKQLCLWKRAILVPHFLSPLLQLAGRAVAAPLGS